MRHPGASAALVTLRPKSDYLPTLDGWRALSIVSVILYHDSLHRIGPLTTQWLYDHGIIGVDIFFAISGLLICSRLLDEEQTSGRISVRDFYIRRAFRILPPAIAFLAVLVILSNLVGLPVHLPEIAASLAFMRNYFSGSLHFHTGTAYYTGHFWSLAVEEHFYLVFPGLLVATPKKWRAPLLTFLAILIAVIRLFHHKGAWRIQSDTRLDALFAPAAIALGLRNINFRKRLIPWLRLWPIAAIALVAVLSFTDMPMLQAVALAWLTPVLILGTMLRPKSNFSRFLELPVLRYVGRISYSLYLWQQLFFVDHFGTVAKTFGVFQRWPVSLALTFAMAVLSYHFLERPLIGIGQVVISSRRSRESVFAAHPCSPGAAEYRRRVPKE